jgi:hypothetical protein
MYCTLSMEIKPKTISCHNQKTDTMAQPKKVPPTQAQQVYLSISLVPMWEFNNVMKISTGRATWELIYMDRWMDGRTD